MTYMFNLIPHCLQMYLKDLEINAQKNIYELDSAHFLSAPRLAWQACLKKTQIELELLTNNDMLLMFEEEIRDGMCQATHRYAKANNKYMKNHDKNE